MSHFEEESEMKDSSSDLLSGLMERKNGGVTTPTKIMMGKTGREMRMLAAGRPDGKREKEESEEKQEDEEEG